jgi:peptidoglycan hydrolase CwlO-like protein
VDELLKSLIYPAIIAAIAAGVSYLASRRIQNADVAAKYQEIARKQAEDNIRLEKCQDELETRVNELEKALRLKDNEIAILKARVTELESENASLKQEIDELRKRRR